MALLKLLRDVALTLAIISLLSAALSSKRRVIRASAHQLGPASAEAGQRRKSDASIDQLMFKVRRNLEVRPNLVDGSRQIHQQQQQQVTDNSSDHNIHNSYHFYANKTTALKQPAAASLGYHHKAADHEPPQEVRVRFLRRAGSGGTQPPDAQQRPHQPSNASLYLLKFSSVGSSSVAGNAIDHQDEQLEEQQQAPPFALLPQRSFDQNQQQRQHQSSPQNTAPHFMQQQQQQPQLNAIGLAHNNIRQILNNYQRYPQSQQLANSVQQQHTPARDPPAAGPQWSVDRSAANPGPLNPLQLLAGPFQAFLPPALGGASQLQPPTGLPQDAPRTSNQAAALSPFSGLLGGQQNPFTGASQSPTGGLENLYQQLPLYQALLAARQRQEAMQAAQRARQQQQQQLSLGNPGVVPGSNQPVQPPFAGLFVPPGSQHQPTQPRSPTQPPAPVQAQPQPQSQPAAEHPPAQPDEQPQGVQFDDDQPNNNNANQIDDQPDNGQPPSDHTNDQSEPEYSNNAAAGGADSDSGKAPAAEEEDPDLKQFQNLANGGDSFTDLFPPGILSNNDISDIRKQQEEQARKQELEERARAAQQQAQQRPHGSPINNEAARDGETGSGGSGGDAEQPEEQANVSQNNGQTNSADKQPADDNNEQPHDNEAGSGRQEDEPDEEDAEDQPADEGPTAAALTSESARTGRPHKSPSSSASFKRPEEEKRTLADGRFARSPGVVYSSQREV